MKMCNGFCSIVPHGEPVAVLTQLRYHVILGLGQYNSTVENNSEFRQYPPHLVDDAVCGEVILVEGPVQADRGDVARADEGADAGALLDTRSVKVITALGLGGEYLYLRHREACQRPLRPSIGSWMIKVIIITSRLVSTS